jgi:hypothetical protein
MLKLLNVTFSPENGNIEEQKKVACRSFKFLKKLRWVEGGVGRSFQGLLCKSSKSDKQKQRQTKNRKSFYGIHLVFFSFFPKAV